MVVFFFLFRTSPGNEERQRNFFFLGGEVGGGGKWKWITSAGPCEKRRKGKRELDSGDATGLLIGTCIEPAFPIPQTRPSFLRARSCGNHIGQSSWPVEVLCPESDSENHNNNNSNNKKANR